MWRLSLIVCLIPWAASQRTSLTKGGGTRNTRQSEHHGHGWDIRLAVPGEPGSDYPTLGTIPRTSFSCAGKEPGYYADLETSCQVFRICTAGSTYGFQSFLCPNGTLFNQAVFVCDWWMNVNCQRSEQLFNYNNDRFGNLRLGPQLMKDIKKMLTHPMRNPYDKSAMKGNLIVMQEYKPPFGQMFPNGALIAPDRPNSVYVPAKQVQSFGQNVFGNTFAASSPSPTYVPPFNTISTHEDAEVFHPQGQSGNFGQSGKLIQAPNSGNGATNGHTGQYSQNRNYFNNGNSVSRPQTFQQTQYNQQQSNFGVSQSGSTNRGGQFTQSARYTDNGSQTNNGRQTQFAESFGSNSNEKQGYAYNTPIYSNENLEAKQNLVSNDVPATIVTKTLTYNRIQDPKPGGPKSRLTFKTWIVKPSKAAKLIATEPTAYNYNRPNQAAKLISEPTPYVYNRPTIAQSARLVAPNTGYSYNRPTTAAKLVAPNTGYSYSRPTTAAKLVAPNTGYSYSRPTTAAKLVAPNTGYSYNRPTTAAKLIATTTVRQPSRLYLTPTVPSPTLSRLYLNPTSAPPTVASKLYLVPTTYKPAAKLYLPPPSTANLVLPRQYLAPNTVQQQPSQYRSDKLRASPTSPSPVYAAPPNDISGKPSFSLTKQSRINANHNNLTFADILTKEKLDITVNDIVSDTSSVLKTASPPQFEQYRDDKNSDYSEVYLPPEESDEKLTPQSPTIPSTSARLIVDPSKDLEPPVDTYNNNEIQNNNRIANLPFFKEAPANTIERTVSLKISIPENIAQNLFRGQNESDFDKLEILNTGSSNYLVLTNNLLTKNTDASFIPIGRLIADKNSNISNSQALVFSLLADSLNAAKEYNNIAQQNIITPSSVNAQQYQQQIHNEDISQITNKIAQLTASQYTVNNHNFNPANTATTVQTSTNSDQYKAAKYTANLQNQLQHSQGAQINSARTSQGYPAQLRNSPNIQSGNQIYSGQLYQLPVPDVTRQIYNADARVVQSNSPQNNVNNNARKQSAEVEIVQSQALPIPARLQAAPTNEGFDSQEHSAQALDILNSGNGISAQINDKITGTIPHPSENKLVTYKKDQSYFVYTKLDNHDSNIQNNQINHFNQQSGKLIQDPGTQNVYTYQIVPSVNYQLESEHEFNVEEHGTSQQVVQNQQQISNVGYSVDHPSAAKQVDGRFGELNTLYSGPSSYSAPQASVGSLETHDNVVNNNIIARLEQFNQNNNNNNEGYSKGVPSRQFSF